MDKKTYIVKFMLWTGIVVAVIMLIINFFTFKVVEANTFEEIAKRVFTCLGILGGYELFAAFLFGPMAYHFGPERKKK